MSEFGMAFACHLAVPSRLAPPRLALGTVQGMIWQVIRVLFIPVVSVA